MTYAPPSITATGLTVPSYQDFLDLFQGNLQNLYGPGVYLGDDSSDHQMLSVLAVANSDQCGALQLEYNNRSTNFAVGAALDSLAKLIGPTRKPSTFSTCAVTLFGTPGTTIVDGLIRDSVAQQGVLWALPTTLTIPSGGTLNTLAVCQVTGSLNALPGQLNVIATPTAGWTSVTNTLSAALGQPVETDSQFRTRLAISTELPSNTLFAGTLADVKAIVGVTRATGDENNTNATNANGNPAHSITMVAEGGADLDVATAIYENKGPGCSTNGTIPINVADPNGIIHIMRFDRPTYVPVFVNVQVHPLLGYTTAVGNTILNALVSYLNSLQIGEIVTQSALYATAMAVTPDLKNPIFSVRGVFLDLVGPVPVATADIPLPFNDVAQGILTNMTLTLV